MTEAFSIPVPARTRTYGPLPHESMWKMINDHADKRGLVLDSPKFTLTKEGCRMFGTAEISNKDGHGKDIHLTIGFRNSYDKSVSAQVCFGSKVLVCSNMVFYAMAGDDGISGFASHRHRRYVQAGLNTRLNEAFAQFEKYKQYQEDLFGKLHEVSLSDSNANDIIIRLAENDAINSKDCLTVAREWKRQAEIPQSKEGYEKWHREFMPRNAFSLFNVITEYHKEIQAKNPIIAQGRSHRLSDFFDKEFCH